MLELWLDFCVEHRGLACCVVVEMDCNRSGAAATAGGGRTVAAVTPAIASLLNQNLHVQNALL